MTKILIINAGKSFHHSKGELNKLLTQTAQETLKESGHEVKVTHIDSGYDTKKEIAKYVWADVVIYQQPGWWMGPPWILKKYIDDIFTEGHGVLYQSDGRSHKNPTKNYGKGGLVQGKKYMFSLTWNAPIEAFTDPAEFFEGVGVDGVYLHLHKANQFLGMTPLTTFICNDVIKNPQIETYIDNYKKHLHTHFK